MEDRIQLHIVTSAGDKWEKNVSSVTLPTAFGSLGILSGHAPMLCAVKKGTVKYRFQGEQTGRIAVSDGIANVADNQVTLLLSAMEIME